MPILRINTNSQTLHENLRKYAKERKLSIGKIMDKFAAIGLKFQLDKFTDEELENLINDKKTSNSPRNLV